MLRRKGAYASTKLRCGWRFIRTSFARQRSVAAPRYSERRGTEKARREVEGDRESIARGGGGSGLWFFRNWGKPPHRDQSTRRSRQPYQYPPGRSRSPQPLTWLQVPVCCPTAQLHQVTRCQPLGLQMQPLRDQQGRHPLGNRSTAAACFPQLQIPALLMTGPARECGPQSLSPLNEVNC
jgi:hypothetical protein